LLPFATDLLTYLREAGAAGSCWSGAGSSMLALVTNDTAASVSAAARDYLAGRGIAGEVLELAADTQGLVTSR
jgi:homoserine kinase